MSKTKFLGIPEGGKRAGWMEMEGGGGGLVFEITESDYTNDTSNYTVTKNYDPIYEQLEKGGSIVIKLHDTTGIVFIVPQMSMVLAGQGFVIISRGMQSNMTLVFTTGSYH